ncbi:Ig-like domain-containing protein [Actinoplanes sp. G11-F43]|uniref:Ig-like domain-containing protein n=1 Tax=Actinoplanes sp. G11-F43 TaxID=3424130 RepID=UPI003D34CD38
MGRIPRSAALLALITALTAGTAAAPAHAAEPPAIGLGLAAGQRVNKTVVIAPVVPDGVDVTRIRLYVNDTLVTRDDVAPWSLSWNTTGWLDGDKRLQLELLDSQGVWTRTDPVTVRVHNHGAIAYFPWEHNSQSTTLNTFNRGRTFDFLVSPGADRDTVTRVDLILGDKVIDSTTSAPWTVTWDGTGPDGRVTLKSRTYDILGNVGTSQVYAFVDRTPPSLEVGFDEVDGFVRRGGRINVASEDASQIDRVELWINGRLVRTDRTIQSNGVGAVHLFWDPAAVNGPATMTVRSYDTVGNIAELTRKVIVDNDRPTVTFSPAANAYVRGTFTTAVTGVRDATGLAYLSGYVNDLAYTHQAPWSVRLNSRNVADGRRTLRVDVMDKAGNVTTLHRQITIDNTAPGISYRKAPKNNTRITRKFAVTAAASDRFGIARVQLLVNGKVVATDTRAAYAFTVNPKRYGKKFTVQLRTYDRAGNVKNTAKRTYRR